MLGLYCHATLPCYLSLGKAINQGLLSSYGAWPSLVAEQALGCAGFSSCSSWTPEHRLNSWGAWASLPWHMGSSQIRDQICVSCIGRQILYHWATKEACFNSIWFENSLQFFIINENNNEATKINKEDAKTKVGVAISYNTKFKLKI